MMKNRILWILWLTGMVVAALFTGSWIYAAVFMTSMLVFVGSLLICLLCSPKITASFSLPKATVQEGSFCGTLSITSQSFFPVFLGKGKIFWENSYTGEKGKIPFSFSLGRKGKADIEFQAASSWCGCVWFSVTECKCYDFFGIWARKKSIQEQGCTVIMPQEPKEKFAFSTREGFDMESFRYSGNRPGDDPGETFDIREYRAGDSIRQIHWKLTGKLDRLVIREKSFPVDDTVLILAESFLEGREPKIAQTLAEVFYAILHSYLKQGISCQAGVINASSGRLQMQKISTNLDCETMMYLFLRQKQGKSAQVIQEYLKNPGPQNFANYIYLTGNSGKDAQLLRKKGEVTVVCCGMSVTAKQGETITWKYGSQKKNKPENSTDGCQVSCWRLS